MSGGSVPVSLAFTLTVAVVRIGSAQVGVLATPTLFLELLARATVLLLCTSLFLASSAGFFVFLVFPFGPLFCFSGGRCVLVLRGRRGRDWDSIRAARLATACLGPGLEPSVYVVRRDVYFREKQNAQCSRQRLGLELLDLPNLLRTCVGALVEVAVVPVDVLVLLPSAGRGVDAVAEVVLVVVSGVWDE